LSYPIVSASLDRTLRIWDAATGTSLAILTGHTGSVNACAVSPDGTWIASAGMDRTLRIWDVATYTARVWPVRILRTVPERPGEQVSRSPLLGRAAPAAHTPAAPSVVAPGWWSGTRGTDDNSREFARLDRDRGPAGHNAQRPLPASCRPRRHPAPHGRMHRAGHRRCPARAASRVVARRTGSSSQVTGSKPAKEQVIVSQVVIVSPPQTITWAVSLDSIVIGERLATTLSGVCMP